MPFSAAHSHTGCLHAFSLFPTNQALGNLLGTFTQTESLDILSRGRVTSQDGRDVVLERLNMDSTWHYFLRSIDVEMPRLQHLLRSLVLSICTHR